MESSLFVKICYFLEIGVKWLGFESGKGLDFLKSENAMRTAAVQKCATIFLSNVRGVHSMIYFGHTNIDLTNMKCRSQLDISSKFSIANEYVLCRYEWHHPIVLIGHSFGGLVLKSLVVKLKRKSTIRNRTDSWSKATVQHGKVFLSNVRGVPFYAVPHAASNNIPKYVNKLVRCNNRRHPGIMDNIQLWQQDMEQLSLDFDDIVNENEINIYAFCEGRLMDVVHMRWMKWIFLQPVML